MFVMYNNNIIIRMSDYFNSLDNQYVENFDINDLYLDNKNKKDNSLTPHIIDMRGQCQTHSTKVNTDCTIEEDKLELMNSTNQFIDEYDNISKDLMSDIRLGSKLFKPIFLEDFWYNDLTERLIEPKHSIQTTKNLITSTIDMIVKSHLFKYFCDNNFINFTESLKRKCINIMFVYPEYRLMCISPSTVTVNANINNRYVNLQDYTYAKMAALTLFKTHYLKYLKTMIMDMSCNDFEDYINTLSTEQQIIVYEFCVIMIYGLIPKNYLCTDCIDCRGCVNCHDCIECDLCINCIGYDGDVFISK